MKNAFGRMMMFALMICGSLSVTAQQQIMPVSGVVEDQAGGAIPNATVTLTTAQAGSTRQTTTDAAGNFSFAMVPPGTYKLKAEANGFEKIEMTLKVSTQPVEAVRLGLKVVVKSEAVTVSGNSRDEEEKVSLQRNADRLNFDEDALRALPAPGQNPMQIISSFLSPAAQGGEGASVVIDGVEASSMNLPAGALRRLRLNRNPFDAEFRRPGKSRVEVYSQEGSFRRYRGGFGFTARNSVFDARNAFAATRPDLNRRLFDWNLAGPLFSKKASFFFSGERLLNDENAVVNAQTPGGALIVNVPAPERRTNLLGRAEFRLGSNHTLLAMYNFLDESQRNRNVGGLRLPEQGIDRTSRNHRLQVSYRAIISPKLMNDFRFVLERSTEQAGRLPVGTSNVVIGAFTGGVPQTFRSLEELNFRLQNISNYVTGNHTLRFGVEIRPRHLTATDATNFGGTFEFSSLSNFAAARPFIYRVRQGQSRVSFTQPEAYGFFQDEMKLHSNLSLTAGVRYGWQANLRDRNNFAPRIAFAYAPGDQKTVIRGGAGIFYERIPEIVRQRSLLDNGVMIREIVISNPAYPDPFVNGNASTVPPSVVQTATNLRAPYLTQASISMERELWKRTNLVVDFTTLRGTRLLRSRNLNAPLPGTRQRPDAARLNINQVESSARSRSNALSVTWRGNAGRWLTAMAQYVYARSYDDTGGLFTLPANNYNLRPEWGRADYDQRHRFNLAGTINLPREFRLGMFVTLASAMPYDITTGQDDNGDTLANDRPFGVTRNTGIGPGLARTDVRLSKVFRLPHPFQRGTDQTSKLEFSVDFFNLFNRTNFENFIGVQSSPFFRRANAARSARAIQFGAKYRF